MAIQYNPRTGLPRTTQATAAPPVRYLQPVGWPGVSQGVPPLTPSVGGPGAGGIGPGGSAPPSINVGGNMPDYASIISSLLQQPRAELAAQGISDASQRAAATQRALAMFGEVPTDLPSFASQDVNAETRALAQSNTQAGLSTLARITKAAQDAKRTGVNQLAARGALQSGELGHFLQEHQQGVTTAQYDARQQLLDYLQGVQAAYVEAERRRKEAEAQALLAATQQAYMQNPPSPPLQASYAFSNPLAGPVYSVPGVPHGFNQQGQPIIASPPSQQTIPVVAPPRNPPRLPGGGGRINRYG